MKNLSQILLIFFGLNACNLFGPSEAQQKASIETVINQYHEALQDEDLERLKLVLSPSKRAEMNNAGADELIKLAKGLSPKFPELKQISLHKNKAKVIASGSVEGTPAEGEIELAQEDNNWLITHVQWNLKMNDEDLSSTEEQTSESNIRRPESFHQLIGTWEANDDGSTAKYKFIYTEDYRFRFENPDGSWFEGEAVVRDDLVMDENGFLMRPSGWTVIDYNVDEASESSWRGEASLGSYIDRANNIMGFCFGVPGVLTRNHNYKQPIENHRCYRAHKQMH